MNKSKIQSQRSHKREDDIDKQFGLAHKELV